MRRWALQTQQHPLLGIDDDRYGAKARFKATNRTALCLKGIVSGLALVVLLTGLYFWTHEVHIEIASYSRGWIKKSVDTLHPLSPPGVCFPPNPLYNLTLANSPKKWMIHAGLALTKGEDCYNFAGLIPQKPTPDQVLPAHTKYHVYWRADLEAFDERQVLLLKSIFATQSLESSSVVLWTNNVQKLASLSPLKALLSEFPQFSIEQIDLLDLANDTPLSGSALLNQAIDKKAWLDGDLARVLLLYRLGGVWVDMDSLLTRDLLPLLESEWVTQWDCYDKPYSPLNGALMHFYQKSPYLCEMLYAMATEPPPRQGTVDWGSFLYHKVWRRLVNNGHKPFAILPWCFADGRSCRLDNRLPDPFLPDPPFDASRWRQLERQIDSVFAIHLHNQWAKSFPASGWIRRIVLAKLGL